MGHRGIAAAALAALTATAAVLALAIRPPAGSAAGRTIKIGLVPPTTGNTAAFGDEMVNGWKLYWSQHGNAVGNTKVQSIFEDTGGDPSVALNKVKKLVNSDHVQMVVGALQANIALAIAGPLAKSGTPYIEPVGASDDLTQRTIPKLFLRLAGHTSSQPNHPFGAWAAGKGYKKVVTICSDYAFGYESCGGFVNTFTDHGGQVAKQLWPPLGTTDFSSYIAQIRQASPDAVFAQMSGADGARFLKAWSDFGLKGKVALLAGEAVLDDTTLHNVSADDALGLISVGVWASGSTYPATKRFDALYEKKYGKLPSFYSASMYVAAQQIALAIKKMHGNISNAKKFIATLRGLKLGSTPLGPLSLDKYGNSVEDVYIRKVVKRNGELANAIVKTYPHVSQFWTYNPKVYLQHPDYSKTYQGDGKWPLPKK